MFQLQKNLFVIFSAIILAGCSSTPDQPHDPAARFYQSYAGAQTNLPTTNYVFSRQCEGITIYAGLPPMPYTIIGSIAGIKLRDPLFALSAKFHGADAVAMVVDKQVVVGTQTDNGMMLFGRGVIFQTPTSTKQKTVIYREGLLIKTNLTILQPASTSEIKTN
jgi:hypothetical protein